MRLNRSSLRMPCGGTLRAALAVPIVGLLIACGGGAAAPAATTVPTAATAAVPAASPQRPALSSPAPSPSAAVSAPAATATTTTTTSSAAADAPGDAYEVQSGDTLLSIAQDKYGDVTQWRRIYDANKDAIGSDPDKLKLGMQLKIPPKQS